MFKDLKKQGILVLLAVSIGVSVVSLIILLKADSKNSFNRQMVVHTYDVLQLTQKLLSSLKDAETGQRGYLLLADPSYLEPYNEARGSVDGTLASLKKLTNDNPAQQERLEVVAKLSSQKFEELQETIDLRLKDSTGLGQALTVVRSGKGKLVMDEIRKKLSEIEEAEKRLLEERNQDLASSQTFSTVTLWVSTIFSISILVMGIRTIQQQTRSREKLYFDLEQKNRTFLFNHGHDLSKIDEKTVVNNLIENLKNATTFIQHVGARNYEEAYIGLSPENEQLNKANLAGALMNMRSQMIKVSEEERKRNWTAEGLAKFAEIP